MAKREHLKILNQSVEVWNQWREDNPKIKPDFTNADLKERNLVGVNFSDANLSGAYLSNADLSDADLTNAKLEDANLFGAKLHNANLQEAALYFANLDSAILIGANLEGTDLTGTFFSETNVSEASFHWAVMSYTTLGSMNLSLANGLEKVAHSNPSTIGIDTLYKSGGNIPEEFLRGCGVPDDFITFIPSHFGVQQAIQFYSCFISYSTKDKEFAHRLYSRMRDEKLRVWFAPEDMKAGRKLHEQIEQAIQLHDRLLIILSEESMQSEWVKREIRNARRAEVRENRRKLFPIRLVDYKAIENWKGFDGDVGEDLAFELGKYYIPDFSNWKDHDTFEREFGKLLRDLRDEEKKQAEKKES